jgi:hypothetical protein
VFIIACLLVPIIGIGFYPKIMTQVYDATIGKYTTIVRASVPELDNPDTDTLGKPPLAYGRSINQSLNQATIKSAPTIAMSTR